MQCVKPVSTDTIALLADAIFSVSSQMKMSMNAKLGEKRTFLLTFRPMEVNISLFFTHLHLAAS